MLKVPHPSIFCLCSVTVLEHTGAVGSVSDSWFQSLKPTHLEQVTYLQLSLPDRVSNPGPLTRKSGVLGSIPGWQHTFLSPSAFSRRAVVSYWWKYVHEALVNRLGGLSLPRKYVVRLTDHPDMTLDVYRGSKTTMQQCNNWAYTYVSSGNKSVAIKAVQSLNCS